MAITYDVSEDISPGFWALLARTFPQFEKLQTELSLLSREEVLAFGASARGGD